MKGTHPENKECMSIAKAKHQNGNDYSDNSSNNSRQCQSGNEISNTRTRQHADTNSRTTI